MQMIKTSLLLLIASPITKSYNTLPILEYVCLYKTLLQALCGHFNYSSVLDHILSFHWCDVQIAGDVVGFVL